jgi:hypothetical protein
MPGKAKKKPASGAGTAHSRKRKASDASTSQNAAAKKANATTIMMSGALKLAKQAKAADHLVRHTVCLDATCCTLERSSSDVNLNIAMKRFGLSFLLIQAVP